MNRLSLAVLATVALLSGCATEQHSLQEPVAAAAPAQGALRIASWNLEFLAEKDGTGCHPRREADYERMRKVVDGLGADIIAFEEVENPAAAARVFDPARYVIVMETRPGHPGGSCGSDAPGQQFIRQAVGFAVRKGLAFTRAPDVTGLEVGNDNLRSGVDITVTPQGGRPLRLLAIHLKSGCFQGTEGKACPQLLEQIPVMAKWIGEAAAGPARFAVLGDWNRRLALPGDMFWSRIDDGKAAGADLRLADAGVAPSCDPRYHDFIDHVVFDKRAGGDMLHFHETTFPDGQNPSDHCPISVDIRR